MIFTEDLEANFRRNLLVYCSTIFIGYYLDIPLAKILEKSLGFDVEKLNQTRIFLIQVIIFLYLLHRHYCSENGKEPFKKVAKKKHLLMHESALKYFNALAVESNWSTKPWPKVVASIKAEMTEKLESAIKANDQPLASAGRDLYLQVQNLNGLWQATATVHAFRGPLDAKTSVVDVPMQRFGETTLNMPSLKKWQVIINAWVRSLFLTSESSEHVFPFLLVGAAVYAFIHKYLLIARYVAA